ncbi:MAG: hypothetical protein ABI972_30080 [Acidobacteriota bacterium]
MNNKDSFSLAGFPISLEELEKCPVGRTLGQIGRKKFTEEPPLLLGARG